jgi:hypothetical protein
VSKPLHLKRGVFRLSACLFVVCRRKQDSWRFPDISLEMKGWQSLGSVSKRHAERRRAIVFVRAVSAPCSEAVRNSQAWLQVTRSSPEPGPRSRPAKGLGLRLGAGPELEIRTQQKDVCAAGRCARCREARAQSNGQGQGQGKGQGQNILSERTH